MKKLIAIILIVVFAGISGRAQSISAGQYGLNDFYWDVSPDYEIIPDELWLINFSELYPLDINGDGIEDFALQTRFDDGNYRTMNGKVFPASHCEIAYFVDTCFADTNGSFCGGAVDIYFNIARVFEYNELIDHSGQWFQGEEIIINQEYHQPCYPCDFINEETFLGIRIFDESDTLYGWVKLGDMNQFKMTVEEFACNTNPFGIKYHEQYLQIYPNPCQSTINISTPYYVDEGMVSISNNYGQILYSKKLNGRINNIDVSDFPPGIYILKYSYQDKVLMKKVLKQ